MTSPIEFAQEWGEGLGSIEFLAPKPLLPASTISFLHYAGVPKSFKVTTYQHIDFDFLSTAANLATVWNSEMRDFSLPVGWAGMWQIGNVTFTQAAAWLCIEEITGRIVAIDVGIGEPLYPVSRSLWDMMECMKVLRDFAVSANGELTHGNRLCEALPAEDTDGFWRQLVENAIESGCEKLVVEYE